MSTSEGQHVLDVLEVKPKASMRWYGHVKRRDSLYVGWRRLRLELQAGGLEENQEEVYGCSETRHGVSWDRWAFQS